MIYPILITIFVSLGIINTSQNLSDIELDRLKVENQEEVDRYLEIHNDVDFE